ncbi:flagellar export chaperone FliS [Rhodocyclaceae bacterium]
MFPSASDPAAAYRKVGLETQLESASPHKLVVMLFDGALLAIANAQRHMENKEIAAKGSAISKAIDIIANGLQASLDLQSGGEIAERLEALYEYMGQRLLYANLKNDPAALREVGTLLQELKSAWEKITDDPAVLSANSKGQ